MDGFDFPTAVLLPAEMDEYGWTAWMCCVGGEEGSYARGWVFQHLR